MSKHHGQRPSSFDSLGTSFGTSPPHPIYYVQSPSRESFDGDKPSFQNTPVLSPSTTPLHQTFIYSPPVRNDQNGHRTAPHLKPGSRKILPQPTHGVALPHMPQKKGYQKWTPSTILEEVEQQDVYGKKRREWSRCCTFWISVLICILIFLTGLFIFWLICQPHSPQVEVKDIFFSEFEVVSGTDEGVPTDVLSSSCNLTIRFANPSKYFGLHVLESSISLAYEDLVVGNGQVTSFYEPKSSTSSFVVMVTSNKLPLYGAGPALLSITEAGGGVTLQVRGVIESRAYVFWKLIKPRFANYFSCSIIVSSSGMNFLKILQKTCS